MKRQAIYAVGAAAIVTILAMGLVLTQSPSLNSSPAGSSTGGNTGPLALAGGANETFIATYVSTIHLASSFTSTTSSTTGTSESTSTTSASSGSSFTYTPSTQVRVLSVAATVSAGGALSFSVQYENIGSGEIYVLGGGGSPLSVNITSGGSHLNQVPGPRCEIATTMVPVSSGAGRTAVTPGCWSGFHYQLVSAGDIQVQMALSWSGGPDQSGGGSIDIIGSFVLA